MVRRIVLGRRANGECGIFVSRPGFDAWDCAEAQLLFSANRQHFMMIQSGNITLGGAGVGVRVNFLRSISQTPLVICGSMSSRPTQIPVQSYPDISGFTAYPMQIHDGSYPAAGHTVPYFAFLKSF